MKKNSFFKFLPFIMVLVFLAGTLSVNAQKKAYKRTPEEAAKRQANRLNKHLELDKEQFQKVYDINLKATKEVRTFRAENKGNRKVIRAEIKKIRQAQELELKEVFTDEQYQKFLVRKEEIKKKRKEKRKNRKMKKDDINELDEMDGM